MQITAALIERFFDDACTPEEADEVSQYFTEHPSELTNYLAGDWETAENEGCLPFDQTDDMLTRIGQQLPDYYPRRGLAKRMLIGWTAAASILLITGLALMHAHEKTETTTPAALVAAVSSSAEAKEVWQDMVNNHPGREKIALPDGSVVDLFTKGHIRYRMPFPADKREVLLEGQATFDIKPLTPKGGHGRIPFIVKAGTVTTTVLGTCFNVSQNEKYVTVRLYKGKVSVHAAAKDIILSPGQQMEYETGHELPEVTIFREEPAAMPGIAAAVPRDHRKALAFDNTPLPEVIDQLIRRYHVPVAYDEKEMSKMYFTGSVLSSDSLLTILHVIANMNDLTILPGKEGFILSVSHH